MSYMKIYADGNDFVTGIHVATAEGVNYRVVGIRIERKDPLTEKPKVIRPPKDFLYIPDEMEGEGIVARVKDSDGKYLIEGVFPAMFLGQPVKYHFLMTPCEPERRKKFTFGCEIGGGS
jgi:hypothetical protein